jgi:hypothetical protein
VSSTKKPDAKSNEERNSSIQIKVQEREKKETRKIKNLDPELKTKIRLDL